MFDLEKKICVCNDVSMGVLAQLIKDENLDTLEALLEQNVCPVGDKCESCHEDGYENDGFSLAMVLGQVKKGGL